MSKSLCVLFLLSFSGFLGCAAHEAALRPQSLDSVLVQLQKNLVRIGLDKQELAGVVFANEEKFFETEPLIIQSQQELLGLLVNPNLPAHNAQEYRQSIDQLKYLKDRIQKDISDAKVLLYRVEENYADALKATYKWQQTTDRENILKFTEEDMHALARANSILKILLKIQIDFIQGIQQEEQVPAVTGLRWFFQRQPKYMLA